MAPAATLAATDRGGGEVRPRYAVIYCRISDDREGAGLGVERQEAECRELADRLGVTVIRVYVDNDISAYNRKRKRPDYLQMMSDLDQADAPKIVLCWHTDRLHRQPIELEAWIDLAEERGIMVRTVKAGELDLSTATGRMTARIVGAVARHESELKSERIKSKFEQSRADGRSHQGPTPFGWTRVRRTEGKRSWTEFVLHDQQARMIRVATKYLLAGGSLNAIVRRWNASDQRPHKAEEWAPITVRNILIRWRNAGLLSHMEKSDTYRDRLNAKIIGKGDWPPIPHISKEDIEALRRLFADNSTEYAKYGPPRRYLLSGIAKCGKCGRVVQAASGSRGQRKDYRCYPTQHMSRAVAPVERRVLTTVATVMAERSAELLALLSPQGDADEGKALQAEADRLRLVKGSLARAVGVDMDMESFTLANAANTKALEAVEQRLRGFVHGSAAAPLLRAEDPAEAFLTAEMDVQRAVLKELVDITINSSGQGNHHGKDIETAVVISWDRVGLAA